MACTWIATFPSDPPEDNIGSSMHVSGKLFEGTSALSDHLTGDDRL